MIYFIFAEEEEEIVMLSQVIAHSCNIGKFTLYLSLANSCIQFLKKDSNENNDNDFFL